ncbi:hypothetical protein H6758_03855 [Candidatus Nomurabacteria bacterium]|nr:hypothetical protein [Candidatus Nomurabacteria bacterium]
MGPEGSGYNPELNQIDPEAEKSGFAVVGLRKASAEQLAGDEIEGAITEHENRQALSEATDEEIDAALDEALDQAS